MSQTPVIAIVDDDPWARDGIRDLVQALGYRVIAFASAEEFLASAPVAETACLITDLQMPGLSGLELQQLLTARGHDTPIILITAYPNEKHRGRAMDAGAIAFLIKPIEERSLIDCLALATGDRGSGMPRS